MPFDFSTVTAPFRMQPGLRRLAPGAPQLTPNRLRERARQLEGTLASMTPEVLAYRGLLDARDRLRRWLAERAA